MENQNNLKIQTITKDKEGYCEKHGKYPLKEIENFYGEKKLIGSCQKCQEEEQNKIITERTNERIKSFLNHSGVPERFSQNVLDDFKTDEHAGKVKVLNTIKDYILNIDQNREVGRSIIIYGPPGTGKTLIICCMIKEIIKKSYVAYEFNEKYSDFEFKEHDYCSLYLTEYHLIRRIKDTWKNSGPDEQMIINQCCEPDVLIIDEVGISFGSETEKILLYQVINGRYERSLPTILASNLNFEDLTRHCGERIIDRMRENQGIKLLFNWDSYRK